MEEDNNSNILTVSIELIQAYLAHMSDMAHLFNLEAKLAMKSLVIIIVLAFVMSLLLLSSWLSAMTLLFVALLDFNFSKLAAAAVVALVNIVVLASLFAYTRRLRKNLLFAATRRQIAKTLHILDENKKGNDNEQPAA